MAKLGEICEIQSGGTPARSNKSYWEKGTIPWAKISDFKGKYLTLTEEYISEAGLKNSSAKIFPSGTILYTIFATLGEVCILNIDATTNQAIAGIKIKTNKLEKNYLYYFLLSIKSNINEIGRGVAQNNINMTILKNIEIPLPPLEEQEKIAMVLDKVSELIEKREQQLAKLDELIKSRFVEMFGDLKINSKNWHSFKLEEIAEVGSSKRVFVEELQEKGIPFYRGTEIGLLAKGKQIEPELFITNEHYEELCKITGKPQQGDLLMPSICSDGRIWVVNSIEPFYFKDGRVLWVHEFKKNINSLFLLYCLKHKIITDYSSIASGTTFAELKIFSLKACKILVPPIELQNQFAEFVEQTEKIKVAINSSLDKLKTLKKALMQRFFG